MDTTLLHCHALMRIHEKEKIANNYMEQLTMLVNKASHSNVKAMFDTHHANIEEKKISQAIKKLLLYLRII